MDHKLTADEVRMIDEKRAKEAVRAHPIDRTKTLPAVMGAMAKLAGLGKQLDPGDGSWDELIEVMVKCWGLRP